MSHVGSLHEPVHVIVALTASIVHDELLYHLCFVWPTRFKGGWWDAFHSWMNFLKTAKGEIMESTHM